MVLQNTRLALCLQPPLGFSFVGLKQGGVTSETAASEVIANIRKTSSSLGDITEVLASGTGRTARLLRKTGHAGTHSPETFPLPSPMMLHWEGCGSRVKTVERLHTQTHTCTDSLTLKRQRRAALIPPVKHRDSVMDRQEGEEGEEVGREGGGRVLSGRMTAE